MARNYKQPSLVSGMSVKDILQLDNRAFNALSESDLRIMTGRLVSAANKRLAEFSRIKSSSPAVERVRQSGGKFSTRGKDLNMLRAEYARIRNFMQSPSGSVRGYNAMLRHSRKALEKQGISMSQDKMGMTFKLYDRLKEWDPSIEERGLKYKIIEDINKRYTEITEENIDRATTAMKRRVKKLYETNKEKKRKYGGVSGFFDIGSNS